MAAGVFPSNLKLGYVTPIFKSGSPADVKNYRPVVIQSAIAKIFESLVLKRLTFHLKSIICTEQHGFMKGRSTTTNLLAFQDYILTAFSESYQVDAIYTDFSKAFDRVSHEHLVAKLEAVGLGGCLLMWLRSYLQGRSLRVRVAGCLSDPFSAISGVPQGSLLGPVLFSIFIDDLVQHTRGSKVLLFADDAKLFTTVKTLNDCQTLQNSIDLLMEWCGDNDITLNISKCSVMSFSRSSTPITFPYVLNDQPLSRSLIVKDLGIMLSPNLNPEAHINNICKRANSAIYFIIRNSRNMFSIQALRILYIHLVRPLLEYSSPVWSPYLIGQIERLENVQNRFIRLVGVILGFNYRTAPIQDLQHQLNLLPLQTRRIINDLMFLRKLINSDIDAPDLLFKLDFRTSRHLRQTHLFARRQYSTQYMFHSTIPRLQLLANNMPDEIDLFCSSSVSFKKKVLDWKTLH